MESGTQYPASFRVVENMTTSYTYENLTMNNTVTIYDTSNTLGDKKSIAYEDIHGYISGTVCFVGVLGNICNMIVWTNSEQKSSANLILSALAFADLMTVLFYMIYAVYLHILTEPNIDTYHSEAGMYLTLVCFHAFIVSSLLSSCLTITLAVFRYIKICKPIDSKTLCNSSRARLAIILVFIFVNLFGIPFYFYYEVCDISEGNVTQNGFWLKKTTFAIAYEDSYQVISLWFCGVFMKLVPCIALIVVSIHMLYVLQSAGEVKKAMGSDGSSYKRTSMMLVTILMIYAFTALPLGIEAFVGALPGGGGEYFYFLGTDIVGHVLDLLPLLNATLNSFVYLLMSAQYRKRFRLYILRQRQGGKGDGIVISMRLQDSKRETKDKLTGQMDLNKSGICISHL